MARFVDLDDSDEESSVDTSRAYIHKALAARSSRALAQALFSNEPAEQTSGDNGHGNEHAIAAALACYPAALSLSTHLDLNDLHSLSLTCRSIHENLTQYRRRLIANSLRCTFDGQPLLSDLRKADGSTSDTRSAEHGIHLSQHGQFTSSYKISGCARDMVVACRKCATVICRNCVEKPPSNKYLTDRHRRLCRICLDAPLSAHLEPFQDEFLHNDTPPVSSASSARSTRSSSGSSYGEDDKTQKPKIVQEESETTFTSNAFLRHPCDCDKQGVYLCAACGHNLRANDITYCRVWTWRSRYSTHIGGGLGTGLGSGDQGQKCGRGDHCLDPSTSSISWVEIDCSDGSMGEHGSDIESRPGSRVGTPLGHRPTSGPVNNKPGYLQQEIEGIGGVVKKKVKKRVKTGATVWEYEDERKSGKYLERETSGRERSWCGWCDRVCLGEQDRALLNRK